MNRVHRFRSMGCEILVSGGAPAEQRATELLFAERDQRFSRFVPESELNCVNALAGNPVRLSSDFAEMLELALAAAEQTGGLVDPTLGDALEAAGYDVDFERLRDDLRLGPAAASAIASVRLRGRLLLTGPGVRLDLNGVVKGKTVDDALALLRGNGFVSAGGDIAVRGPAVVALPGGGTVQLVAGALATSGRDRRRWLRGGRPQHHLIDPASGRPSPSPWQTVTACGATCVGADVAAKAAFLLGDEGPGRLDEWNVPCRFVHEDGRVIANEAWSSSVQREEALCT